MTFLIIESQTRSHAPDSTIGFATGATTRAPPDRRGLPRPRQSQPTEVVTRQTSKSRRTFEPSRYLKPDPWPTFSRIGLVFSASFLDTPFMTFFGAASSWRNTWSPTIA